jgi:uncharacterized repeat protein (TIGR03803 family)
MLLRHANSNETTFMNSLRRALLAAVLGSVGALLAQGDFAVLHSFTGTAIDGGSPQSTLTEVSPGVFYGTTAQTLFRITSAGRLTTLHTFSNTGGSNPQPQGRLWQAQNGKLYGVTFSTLTYGTGVIFEASLRGAVTVLNQTVTGPSPLVGGSDGLLYGIAVGMTSAECFNMDLSGGIKVLDTFPLAFSQGDYGSLVAPPVLQATDGSLWGEVDGNIFTPQAYGFLFRADTKGDAKRYTPFQDFNGWWPVGGLVQAGDGSLFGVTEYGGLTCTNNFDETCGAIFHRSPDGTQTDIYNFGPDHAFPHAGLLLASDGNFYGSTTDKNSSIIGNGSIYQVTPAGVVTYVHSFSGADGQYPMTDGSALVQGSDGKLYGTTSVGGANGAGNVFVLDLGLSKPLPAVVSFRPAAGAVGTQVILLGSHFVGASGVSFGGIPATTFSAQGDSYVIADVPTGAVSGPITVSTANGSVVAAGTFTVQ